MTNHDDHNLHLLTRLALLFCYNKPQGVRVRRMADRSLLITSTQADAGQFIGKGGSHIKAITYLFSKFAEPEKVVLARISDDQAYTDDSFYQPNTIQKILPELLEAVTGYPIIYAEPKQGEPTIIRIPHDTHTPELVAAIKTVTEVMAFGTGEYMDLSIVSC